MLLIRGPPSDSDGEAPRLINGVVQSPQQLWDVGCRIYMTAVPNVFWAWRTEAEWRADWREVWDLHVWMAVRNVFRAWRTEAAWRADWGEVGDLHVWTAVRNVFWAEGEAELGSRGRANLERQPSELLAEESSYDLVD